MQILTAALIGVAVGFAFSMGAHYTGACMGMARASGAIRLVPALLLMAPLTFVGAAVASQGVEATVGHGLLSGGPVSVALALAIVGSAFTLTSLFNFVRLPTSTIQILVFSVVGVGLEQHLSVNWPTVETLLALWAVAPFAAFSLGYLGVRLVDRHPAVDRGRAGLAPMAATVLVAIGAAASFAMGANDVANASGPLIMTGLFSPIVAGTIGGAGLAVGVLTWGRPLLEKVAFDIVHLDGRMATAAQFAQATVILGYVTFGYFTSMNQALVGAMLGAGVARGAERVRWRSVRDILAGWAVGPGSGAALGFLAAGLMATLGLL